MSGTFSNLIREVFSYWFVRALLYPKMTPRTYNLFTVFVVFKRRKKRKSEVRTRRRKRRRILENGWGFVHHRRLEKEGEKRNLSRRNPPRTSLSRTAPRAEKRETHISRHVLCVCTVIHPSHRSRSPFSLSFSPQQKIRALRIKNRIITIVKTNAEENDATRNEKRHRISPKTNNKQRV